MPTEETNPVVNSTNVPVEKINLGGKEYEVVRLKAGKFYEAQRIFADIIKSVRTDSGSKAAGQEGEVLAVDLDQVSKVLSEVPQKVARFVAYCIGVEEKVVLDEAYPEEINEAFGVCLRVNNVIENLKNFAAPMEKLGAAAQE